VDYFTPQLYWPIGAPAQPYPVLLRWWAEQNVAGRNLWPGNYTSRVGERSRTAWRTDEIVAQIDATRAEAGATGNVHFSAKVFLQDRDSLATRMGAESYPAPALVPSSPWLAVEPQGEPQVEVRRTLFGRLEARLAPSGATRPRWWLVQERTAGGRWTSALVRGEVKEIRVGATVDRLAVRAVDAANIEGPARVVRIRD
jgi:hypothetical protein